MERQRTADDDHPGTGKEKQLSDIENNINEKVERIDESQKEYYLREKPARLKKNWAMSNQSDDSEELRRMIEENPYPEAIRKRPGRTGVV
ncbi:MAG: hypothetical protein ACLVJ6_18185 [Merdibacter sp.]